MKRATFAATVIALGLAAATAAVPARADEADLTFEKIFRMADKNSDKMITKQEFLDAMGKAYDMKMAKMKKMPDASSMMKGDAMTRAGLKSLVEDIYHGA